MIIVSLPNLNNQSLVVNPATGLIQGTFNHPDIGSKVTRFRGALLQNRNATRGYFLGSNQSGSIRSQEN